MIFRNSLAQGVDQSYIQIEVPLDFRRRVEEKIRCLNNLQILLLEVKVVFLSSPDLSLFEFFALGLSTNLSYLPKL